jgi:hypothetical protein
MTIAFSNPYLLALIPILAPIPFILELLSLKRPRRKEISSIMLILGPKEEARGWRIPKRLIPILRSLILSLIALSISGPKISGGAKDHGICIIAVDRSMSMRYLEGKGRAIDKARDLAQKIASRKEGAFLLAFDDRVYEISPRPLRAGSIDKALSKVEPSYRTTKPEALLSAIKDLRKALGKDLPAYVISDFRGEFWKEKRVDGLTLVAVPVSSEALPEDCSIVSVEPSDPYPFPTTGFDLLVRFRTYGVRKCRISVQVDGSKTLDVDAIGGAEDGRLRVPMALEKPGWHTGTVTIRPSGFLKEGDTAFFSVYLRPYVSIALLGDNIYLEKAINPFDGGRGSYLRLRNARGLGDVGKEDIVVASDIGSMSEADLSALRNRLDKGGKAILFCGSGRRIPSWICGGEVVGRLKNDKGFLLQDFARSHKALRIFSDPRNGNLMLTRFYDVLEVKPSDPKARVLAFLQDEVPAMIEVAVGRGTLIFFPFSLDPSSTDLPLKPFFPPLVHELIKYLAEDKWKPPSLHGQVGRSIPLPFSSFGEDGLELLDPSGRRLEVAESDHRFVPEIPGIYRVMAKDRGVVLAMAVNVPSRELDLKRISDKELRELGWLELPSSSPKGKEIDLVPAVILLAALVLLAEGMLIRP